MFNTDDFIKVAVHFTNEDTTLTLDDILEVSRRIGSPECYVDFDNLLPVNKHDSVEVKHYLFICWFDHRHTSHLDDSFFLDTISGEAKMRLVLNRIMKAIDSIKSGNILDDDIVHHEFGSWEHYQNQLKLRLFELSEYVSEFDVQNYITPEEYKSIKTVDKRISKDAPTNKERINALEQYCPELWSRLEKSQDKVIQQNVIHHITGVNIEDSYKYSFGSRHSEIVKLDHDKVNVFKEKLNVNNK